MRKLTYTFFFVSFSGLGEKWTRKITPITNLYARALNRAVISDAERLNWTRLIECCIFALRFDMHFLQTNSKLERYVRNSNLKTFGLTTLQFLPITNCCGLQHHSVPLLPVFDCPLAFCYYQMSFQVMKSRQAISLFRILKKICHF